MRDPITDAAQDPSCLLCLTPDRGGSWWSRLRPAMPRDFSVGYQWDALQVAMYSSLPWTSDYHFTFDFTVADDFENGSYWIMYQSNGRISFALDKDARGCRFVFGSYSFSGGVFVYAPFASSLAGRHEVTLAVEGVTLRVTVDGTVYEQSGERVESSAYNRVVTTSAPVTLHAVSLTDDSTGTAVWQAAYSDLYDTSNPWPSPVPENFAENAKAFYDCQAVVQEALDPTHDYSFLIEAEIVRENQECSMFYAGGDKFPFGVYVYSDNTIRVFSNLLRSAIDTSSKYATVVAYSGDTRLQGRHTIELRIEGDAMRVFLDGNEIENSYKFVRIEPAAVGLPNCNSGYVYKIQITDLTDNQVVWSYPSEAERVRLITKTNVRTNRGAFEAADETRPARVDTALDLRGKVSSYTVVVDFEAAEMDTDVSAQQLCGQGSATNMTAVDIAACMYYRQSSRYYLRHVWELAGSSILFYAEVEKLTGRHQLTAVLQINETSGGSAAMLYLDGKLIHTATNNDVPTGAGSAESFSLMEPANTSQTYSRKYGKVYSGLLFDRALSAAEIAALTPKKQPLSWAGIRDVVRRGRAQRYFAVGDVLTVATPRWTIEYEVTGFDQAEPADAALTHSMTLLPVRLVTNLQFDATEPGNPDANRAQYGCNRWDWSAIRQWLNSAAAPGEWWTAQHEYDAAPAYAATLAGFMADLPADFLSAVAPARLTTALSNADGGGSVETVDRFWLPSRTEIFGALDGGIAEGVQMAKYIDATDADRIKYNSAGTASGWEFRSPNRSNSYNISNVSANGTWQDLTWSSAWSGGIVPACIIA